MISKSESNKIYYQKNKDRLAEKWKNDESRKAYLREYYKKNKEIILERAREWNKRNKEARKLIIEREKRNKLKPFWEINLQNK
jgi:pyruvate-formate lyase